MRSDFSNVTSLRQLSSEEWTRFRQSDPARFAALETELNGGGVQKADTPRKLEISVNGYVQNREEVTGQRFVNGILQP
jgi:hypothetical protein